MAGSYGHLRRDPTAYGGVDTSLCENTGDAIEAMVGMYWMIQILSEGDPKRIAEAERMAIEIEAGRKEPP